MLWMNKWIKLNVPQFNVHSWTNLMRHLYFIHIHILQKTGNLKPFLFEIFTTFSISNIVPLHISTCTSRNKHSLQVYRMKSVASYWGMILTEQTRKFCPLLSIEIESAKITIFYMTHKQIEFPWIWVLEINLSL